MLIISPTSTFDPTEWKYILNKPKEIEILFTVGEYGFPSPGTNVYSNPILAGRSVIVTRNSILQWSENPGDGNSYFEHTGEQIFFYGPLLEKEQIQIIVKLF